MNKETSATPEIAQFFFLDETTLGMGVENAQGIVDAMLRPDRQNNTDAKRYGREWYYLYNPIDWGVNLDAKTYGLQLLKNTEK